MSAWLGWFAFMAYVGVGRYWASNLVTYEDGQKLDSQGWWLAVFFWPMLWAEMVCEKRRWWR